MGCWERVGRRTSLWPGPFTTHQSSDDTHNAPVHAAEDNHSEPRSNEQSDAHEEKEDEATWQALALYLRAMGPRRFWIVTLVAFGFCQLSDVILNLWAREWAGHYAVGTTQLPWHKTSPPLS